jgi:hypothetical protein
MSKFKVGDTVTVKRKIECYDSGRYNNPQVFVTPGMVGEVKAVDVSYVTRRSKFNCVDFEMKVPHYMTAETCRTSLIWRIGAADKDIKLASPTKPPASDSRDRKRRGSPAPAGS